MHEDTCHSSKCSHTSQTVLWMRTHPNQRNVKPGWNKYPPMLFGWRGPILVAIYHFSVGYLFLLSARKPSVQSCPFSCNHAIIMQWLFYALHHTLTEIRREGTGGGWVGGIITFGTTYIMSLCHHLHIIMQSLSSRNHRAIIMLSLTYAFHHTLTEIRRAGTGGG